MPQIFFPFHSLMFLFLFSVIFVYGRYLSKIHTQPAIYEICPHALLLVIFTLVSMPVLSH